MISVGHRTGLFDAMRESLPATSRDIAERTGLNARYVREWLGALLTAGAVEFEPVTKQFFLPPEHPVISPLSPERTISVSLPNTLLLLAACPTMLLHRKTLGAQFLIRRSASACLPRMKCKMSDTAAKTRRM